MDLHGRRHHDGGRVLVNRLLSGMDGLSCEARRVEIDLVALLHSQRSNHDLLFRAHLTWITLKVALEQVHIPDML